MKTGLSELTHTRKMPFFERHAWKVLLAVIVMVGFFGVGDMINGAADLQYGETVFMHSITGMSWDDLLTSNPNVARLIDTKFRMDGAALAGVALLSLAICLTAFRKGERWAWFAMWVLPLWSLLTAVFILAVEKQPGWGTPVPVMSGTVLFLICAVVLGLSSRKFFQS